MNLGISLSHCKDKSRLKFHQECDNPQRSMSNFDVSTKKYTSFMELSNRQNNKLIMKTVKKIDVTTNKATEMQETRLQLLASGNNTPIQNLRQEFDDNFSTQRYRSKQAKTRKKNKLLTGRQLMDLYKECRKRLQQSQRVIFQLKMDKVEYEEIVYQLKRENLELRNERQVSNKARWDQEKLAENCRSNGKNVIDSQVINFSVGIEVDVKLMGNKEKSNENHCELLPSAHKDSLTNNTNNHQNLQFIINDLRKKISDYEKKLTQKTTFYNHQYYLYEKMKNQNHQLNITQTSLLEELQFVLKKNKKLKKENDQLRKDNQQKVRDIVQLEQQRDVYQNEIEQLERRIRDMQSTETEIQIREQQKQKHEEQTEVTTKAPQKSTNHLIQIDYENDVEIFSKDLVENLNEICEFIDNNNNRKSEKQCRRNLQIIGRVLSVSIQNEVEKENNYLKQKQQKNFKNLTQTEVNCSQISVCQPPAGDEMSQKQARISHLEQQLQWAWQFQQQMSIYLQQSKWKLTELGKQLQMLSIEHNLLKNKYNQEVKHRQLNRSMSFIEELKDGRISQKQHEILSAVSIQGFNDHQ